jgi:hypothetical protein
MYEEIDGNLGGCACDLRVTQRYDFKETEVQP